MPDEKHAGGRPLKFQNVAELQDKIDAYFAECDREEDTRIFKHGETFEWIEEGKEGASFKVVRCKECRGRILDEYKLPTTGCALVSGAIKRKTPYTITGLALALGTTRETLLDYEARDEFSDSIRNAKMRCHNYMEIEGLFGDMAPQKATFGLSNYGWRNPQHIDQTITMKKDGAAELAKALFDDKDEEEDTPVDDFDSPGPAASASEGDLAAEKAEGVQEDQQDTQPVSQVV